MRTALKLDGGGFDPFNFLAAALAAASCSASCLAARRTALLFVLGVILGAKTLLGRGFNFEADDGGRSSSLSLSLLLVPLGLLYPFMEGEATLTVPALDGLRVPRTEVERLIVIAVREGPYDTKPEACEAGRRMVWG